MMLKIVLGLCLFGGFTFGGVFEDVAEPISNIQSILQTFNEVALEKYRSAMPSLPAVSDEVNSLLDEINSSVDNKRMMNQTRVRYTMFMQEAQNAITSALKLIETGLNDVTKSSITATNQIFDSAKSLDADLTKKNCSQQEIIDLLKPYINQTVECVRNAAKIEVYYEKNAIKAARALDNILESVTVSLQLCTNKGLRSAMCSQRVSIFLGFMVLT